MRCRDKSISFFKWYFHCKIELIPYQESKKKRKKEKIAFFLVKVFNKLQLT